MVPGGRVQGILSGLWGNLREYEGESGITRLFIIYPPWTPSLKDTKRLCMGLEEDLGIPNRRTLTPKYRYATLNLSNGIESPDSLLIFKLPVLLEHDQTFPQAYQTRSPKP